jgi:hypothetical protein
MLQTEFHTHIKQEGNYSFVLNHFIILFYRVQVVAAPFQDRLSIAVANELEAAFGGWTEPPASKIVA